jgi:ABC-type multidrug transport system permease subunit
VRGFDASRRILDDEAVGGIDSKTPVARILPVTYGLEALRGVMIRGAGLDDATLQLDLLVLLGIAVVVMILATRTIRREIA